MATTTESDLTGRIVVGVDGSLPSLTALRWAARLAPSLKARIEAVTVWEFPVGGLADLPTFGWGMAAGQSWQPDADAEAILEAALRKVFGDSRPAGLVANIALGHPTQALLTASVGADLLVVGSRGHGGFAGLLLGSVSAACAEHAKCAVLVVHGDDVGH